MATQALQSAIYELADALDVNKRYQQNGWTDGLPIVPPTEQRVREFRDAAGLAPVDIIGVESVRQRPIRAEKAAINAVMAGCLPTYMPVAVAVLRAMCVSGTTCGAPPALVGLAIDRRQRLADRAWG
jgi:hypothetical protein